MPPKKKNTAAPTVAATATADGAGTRAPPPSSSLPFFDSSSASTAADAHLPHLLSAYKTTIDEFYSLRQLEQYLYCPWRREVGKAFHALSDAMISARVVLNAAVRAAGEENGGDATGEALGGGRGRRSGRPAASPNTVDTHTIRTLVDAAGASCQQLHRHHLGEFVASCTALVTALKAAWPMYFTELHDYALHDVVCLGAALDTVAVLVSPPVGSASWPKVEAKQPKWPPCFVDEGAKEENATLLLTAAERALWVPPSPLPSPCAMPPIAEVPLNKKGDRRGRPKKCDAIPSTTATGALPTSTTAPASLPIGTRRLCEAPIPLQVRVKSEVPCERFEGSSTLWARCDATLQPHAHGTIAAVARRVEEVMGHLMALVDASLSCAVGDAPPPPPSSPLYMTARSRARHAERAEALRAFASHYRDVYAVSIDRLVMRGLMPLWRVEELLAANGMDVGMLGVAVVTIGGSGGGSDMPQEQQRTSPAPPHTTTNTISSVGSDSSAFIPVVQLLSIESLHFAPWRGIGADPDSNQYAFQSTMNASLAGERGGGGGGGRVGHDRQHTSVTKATHPSPLLFLHDTHRSSPSTCTSFAGPHPSQCYMGAFIGFPLLIRYLQEEARGRGVDGSNSGNASPRLGAKRPRSGEGADRDEDDGAAPSSFYIPSLNGPVIILGMGGNVAANLVCEQLLAPTAEGRAFLAANPLFSLHVVELEPSVMRTCGLNGLLPGYEHLPEGLLGLGAEGEEEEAMIRPTTFVPTANTTTTTSSSGGDGTPTPTATSDSDSGGAFIVRRSRNIPSWLHRSAGEEEGGALSPSHCTAAYLAEDLLARRHAEYRAAIAARVHYHIGVDAMTADLLALVNGGGGVRGGGGGGGGGDDPSNTATTKNPSRTATANNNTNTCVKSPLILFDCFDPMLSAVADPFALVTQFRKALDPASGMLCVNAHYSPAFASNGTAFTPFLEAFGSDDGAYADGCGGGGAAVTAPLSSASAAEGRVQCLQYNALSQFFVVMSQRSLYPPAPAAPHQPSNGNGGAVEDGDTDDDNAGGDDGDVSWMLAKGGGRVQPKKKRGRKPTSASLLNPPSASSSADASSQQQRFVPTPSALSAAAKTLIASPLCDKLVGGYVIIDGAKGMGPPSREALGLALGALSRGCVPEEEEEGAAATHDTTDPSSVCAAAVSPPTPSAPTPSVGERARCLASSVMFEWGVRRVVSMDVPVTAAAAAAGGISCGEVSADGTQVKERGAAAVQRAGRQKAGAKKAPPRTAVMPLWCA